MSVMMSVSWQLFVFQGVKMLGLACPTSPAGVRVV